MSWKFKLLIIVAFLLYWAWHAPWEWRMRRNFNEHFEAFQKLEQMQREDIHRTFYIGIPGEGTVHSGKGLSKERWAEYIELLDEANLSYMIYAKDEPKKRKVMFHEEGANDWGYAYMEYPPPSFFNSFKECVPIMPSESCFVLLRKNWYLFTEHFRLEQTDAK